MYQHPLLPDPLLQRLQIIDHDGVSRKGDQVLFAQGAERLVDAFDIRFDDEPIAKLPILSFPQRF